MSKILEVILGAETVNKINNCNVLIVGVGGIGCEIVKNLSKSGFRQFTLFDLDHIENTNLNRQFYFRKDHIGMPKAEVGKLSILKIDPTFNIQAICSSIYQSDYDDTFFEQFDIVVSALDNMKAREYLAKMCSRTNRPIVDAGTGGYSSYTKSCIRFLNKCHNCVPTKQEESFAVCTIRNTPERPAHCIHYAKSFYDCFMGSVADNDLKGEINYKQYVSKPISKVKAQQIAVSVFNILFFQKIIQKLPKDQDKPVKLHTLTFEQAIQLTQPVTNPPSTFNLKEYKQQQASIYEEETLWSISKYAIKFVEAFVNILTQQYDQLGTLSFEKDDDNCMMLVYCISNLRTYNFMDRTSGYNKHKYLTYYQAKDVAGKIIPAIASTNSIAAGTEIQEIIKILNHDYQNLKSISYNNNSSDKLFGTELSEPNPNCSVCSITNIHLKLQCDFTKTTYLQLKSFFRHHFCQLRPLYTFKKNGQISTIREQLEKKLLSQVQDFITQNNAIRFQCKSEKEVSDLNIEATMHHRPNANAIQVIGQSKYAVLRRVINFYRNKVLDGRATTTEKFKKYGYK